MTFEEEFIQYMINYYQEHGRHYPWRKNRTPYRVYLSEMLLQRTRADQVVPVYERLIEEYPDIISLSSDFKRATDIMQPLGRFVRLQYFKQGLEYLLDQYDGEIPVERENLLSIPGTGLYIAGAVRVFGFGIKDTIVDANVVRVLGRIYGLQVNPETRRRKAFIELAAIHVPEEGFAEYSYGLLDFAAEVCRAYRPKCDICCFEGSCIWRRQQP
jgi:A/G-specific adenine glycosylase